MLWVSFAENFCAFTSKNFYCLILDERNRWILDIARHNFLILIHEIRNFICSPRQPKRNQEITYTLMEQNRWSGLLMSLVEKLQFKSSIKYKSRLVWCWNHYLVSLWSISCIFVIKQDTNTNKMSLLKNFHSLFMPWFLWLLTEINDTLAPRNLFH